MTARLAAAADRTPAEKRLILLTILLSTGVIALSATSLSTAVPVVAADLGDLASFPWLFTAYQICLLVSIPIYSKLADRFGRKPLVIIGIVVFLAGSILAGASWSMPALIGFRALQGLGAGAIQPIATTIAGDVFHGAERARIQGYIGTLWAGFQVLGPLIGGLLVQFVHWRWIFYLNLPVCLVSLGLLVWVYRDRITPKAEPIDYRGSALLALGSTLVILGLLGGGRYWDWLSPWSIGCFGLGAVALVVLGLAERGRPYAVLPAWLFTNRGILACVLVALVTGSTLLGMSSYIPLFLQRGGGIGPTVAGLALAGCSLGWALGSNAMRLVVQRIGFRWTCCLGLLCAAAGAGSLVACSWLPPQPWVVGACIVLFGLGAGISGSAAMIAAQSQVEAHRRAVATGAVVMGRSGGNLLGAATFGAIATAAAGGAAGLNAAPPPLIVDATRDVFVAVAVVCLLGALAATRLPNRGFDLLPVVVEPAAPE